MYYNNFMPVYEFRKTNDGSIGLYNFEVKDIYHSKFGAFSEAIEKFAKPAYDYINTKEFTELNLTDICYGIGYNTLSFLQLLQNYKKNIKININILEIDKSLILYSPFIKNPYLNFSLKVLLFKKFEKEYNKKTIYEFIKENNNVFIDKAILRHLNKKFSFMRVLDNQDTTKRLIVHNTYYNYLSFRAKNKTKFNYFNNIVFYIHTGDARTQINHINKHQNIIFLDAFSPNKSPILWTKQFFSKIYKILDENGIILTYSKSAAIRSAFLENNFFIGKTSSGTLATKSINNIKTPLNDFEKGLLNTNAGIPFYDYNLSMTTQEIFNDKEKRKKILNKESSTHYANRFKK